jgi:hypothetical protein
VANGLSTNHPIPDLPFVDDSHIPVYDSKAIEAIGRRPGTDMWGREDPVRDSDGGGWIAFTTDPGRHDLAWCVRWHPAHGRSVIVYRDEEISSVHMAYWGPPLLFRAGGYWWDGTSWYRPAQVWDAAGEEYYRRPVPSSATVTAADLLSNGKPDPAAARVVLVAELDPDVPWSGRWIDHLALWAAQHGSGDMWLRHAIVTLTAPELTADQMVGIAEVAEFSGIAASTLRAYIARGEAGVPLPQAVIGGRSAWARPVAEEWAEARRRSPEGVEQAVSARRPGPSVPVGVVELWSRFTRIFFAQLWERPAYRKRWAMRWRTDHAVRDLAEGLGWEVAASLNDIIPIDALAKTIEHALLDEFATEQERSRHLRELEQERNRGTTPDASEDIMYGITPRIASMLGWLVRHDPAAAGHVISAVTGEAERRMDIPRSLTEYSLKVALELDSGLGNEALDEFLSRVLSPTDNQPSGA